MEDYRGITIDHHGSLWITMDHCGFPWTTKDDNVYQQCAPTLFLPQNLSILGRKLFFSVSSETPLGFMPRCPAFFENLMPFNWQVFHFTFQIVQSSRIYVVSFSGVSAAESPLLFLALSLGRCEMVLILSFCRLLLSG